MLRTKALAPSTAQLGLLVAVSVFAWSFGPICVRFAFQYDVPPALVAFGRMITGTVIFAPYILYRGRREIREMPARSRWLASGRRHALRHQYHVDGDIANAYKHHDQSDADRDHPDLGSCL